MEKPQQNLKKADNPPREGRRIRKARATRQALYEAGLSAFQRQPIQLVSILDITEAADVAKGVFYLHFPSKDQFLLSLLEEVQEQFLDSIRSAVLGSKSPTHRLESAIRTYLVTAAVSPKIAKFKLRIASFLGDELGKPGQLYQIRVRYLRNLASILQSDQLKEPTKAYYEIASQLETFCWGKIWQALRDGTPLPKEKTLLGILPALAPFLKK